LTREDCEVLASSLLGEVSLPPRLVAEIIDAAAGNPFFLEEVLASLADVSGMVDSGWNLRRLDVPTTLHGAVMSRVDGLLPRDKQTLQAAAVAGRVFSHEVLLDVRGEEFEASLEELQRREFIHASGIGEYAFRQPMTAEVAYDSLLKSQRIELHRRTGEAIERLFPGRLVELSPVLAYHYEAAGVGEKAFEYLVHAARRAAAVSANREALRRYRRALAICEGWTDRASPSVVRDRAALHEEVADVCVVVGNYADARTHYDAAVEGADDEARVTTLRRKTAQMLQRWRRHDEARVLFESLLGDAGKALDRIEAAHIYSGLGMARYYDGDLNGALDLVRRSLEQMAALGDRRGVAQSHSHLGVIHTRRGDHDEAVECHRRAMVEYEGLGDDYGLAVAYNNLGLALRERADLDGAVRAFEQGAALFEKVGNRHGLACVWDNLGQVHMDREDADAAHECLKRSVAIMAEISMDREEMRPEMWYTGAM
jgi:adenylate cyclase